MCFICKFLQVIKFESNWLEIWNAHLFYFFFGKKKTPIRMKGHFEKRALNISLKETKKEPTHIKDFETGKYGMKTNFVFNAC